MAAGAVNGKTIANLKEIGAGDRAACETDVNILGKIGEFGQPIIRKKANAMLKEFVENIKKQLSGSNGSPPSSISSSDQTGFRHPAEDAIVASSRFSSAELS
jgi:hypothetical protein